VTHVPRELWPIVCQLANGCAWPPHGDAEIDAFFQYAVRQKLLPLLLASDDLPSEVSAAKARFRALDALYRRRYELSRIGTLELQRVLGTDAFLFFKGADYRHRLYAQPHWRPMEDIDVFLPPNRIGEALRELRAAGYPRKHTDFGAAFSPWHHEVSVVIGKVHVELHRSFSQRVRASIDYDGLWRRRESFENDGVRGYRLAPADAILAHAFGLAKDEFSSDLNRYVDFFLLLQRYEDELGDCVARAKAWQIERPLFGALYLTSTMFRDVRTEAVTRAMEALLDLPTRRFLVARVLPDPTREPSGWVSGRRTQIRRKFGLIDRRWRKLAFIAYQIYATAVGAAFEWREHASGLKVPSRSGARAGRMTGP
jgi:hypothetical protein